MVARDPSTVAALQDLVPEWATPLVVGATHLGDPVVLLALLAPLYWLGDRYGLVDRWDGFRLVAVGVGGAGLILALKAAFALQRPPSELWLIHADGPAFPSGHATAATVLYGGLAHYLRPGTLRARAAVGGTLVAAVAASRVLLGVHYPADVLAGVVVGVGYLAVATRIVADRDRAFPFAALMGVAALVGTAFGPGAASEGAIVLGAAVGASVAWIVVRGRSVPWSDPHPGVAAAALAGMLGLFLVTRVLDAGVVASAAINSVTGVTVVALPSAVQNVSR